MKGSSWRKSPVKNKFAFLWASRGPAGKAEDGAYGQYSTDEQRRQTGWIGGQKCEVILDRAPRRHPSGARTHGEGKIRSIEAARQHRDDRAHRSREDDADGGDHDGAVEARPEERGAVVRFDRQRAGRAGAGDHDRDGARGIYDGEPALRARGLPGACGLHQEHDHGGGPDGRGDSGGGGDRWADAADARAHSAGASGGGAVAGGVPEQGGHGGRRGAAGPGGAGGAGAADVV